MRIKRSLVTMPKPTLNFLDTKLAIHRLSPTAEIPRIVFQSTFYSITKTADELAIICDSRLEIVSEWSESGWSAIQVAGPLDFSLTGILAGISGVLARAKISIVAVSTFDTNYILVRTNRMNHARQVLEADGIQYNADDRKRPQQNLKRNKRRSLRA